MSDVARRGLYVGLAMMAVFALIITYVDGHWRF